MTCRKLYDVKSVAYQSANYSDYMSAIGTAFQEILIQKDGMTLDTKAENAEFTELNGTRYTDGERIGIRSIGSLKFTKNVDTSLLANHSDLIEAGLGEIIDSAAVITVTGGKGSVATPFLSGTTTGINVGDIIYNATYGYFIVASIIAGQSFVVTNPLTAEVTNGTAFSSPKKINITNPIGNCSKTFNFVISLHDGKFIELLGCGVTCELTPVFEKQLTINFTITSPEIVTVDTTPITGGLTAETKGVPIICNFTSSLITTGGVGVVYYPANFELGLTITSEPMRYIGGRNNIQGYMSRSSIKPKITFDTDSTSRGMVSTNRTERKYTFCGTSFSICLEAAKLTLIEQSMNNNNHDSIQCEMDANYKASTISYLVLP